MSLQPGWLELTDAAKKAADQRFNEHLRQASEVVAKWPEWKRNILGDPTVTQELTEAEVREEYGLNRTTATLITWKAICRLRDSWLRLHQNAREQDAEIKELQAERNQLRAELKRRDAAIGELATYAVQHTRTPEAVHDIIRRAREPQQEAGK